MVAGGTIGTEVGRIGFFELQRDTPAHDADAVDRVDHSLCIRREYVALPVLDHADASSLEIPFRPDRELRPVPRADQSLLDVLSRLPRPHTNLINKLPRK